MTLLQVFWYHCIQIILSCICLILENCLIYHNSLTGNIFACAPESILYLIIVPAVSKSIHHFVSSEKVKSTSILPMKNCFFIFRFGRIFISSNNALFILFDFFLRQHFEKCPILLQKLHFLE